MKQRASNAVAHWADEVAATVARGADVAVVSSGISPSGEIHIGNMREVLTADAVYRALRDRGVEARLDYVCDNFDPLRRVYPFLDEGVYGPLVGRPLSEIPCPCGAHESYAEHFLEPFLESLRRLRVDVEVVRADRLYKSGRMNPVVLTALAHRDRIATILRELTGKEEKADWSPFAPLCPSCRRITQAKVVGYSAAHETVDVACACGEAGTFPIAGGGKLLWRIDWPARWKVLGVTVEPFGKDHATRGGSYDTGVRISREVFGADPPLPIPYEWISLRGRGDMSSSKGNVFSIADALEFVPPEVLRYLVLREKPQRTITFDPGLPLLQLVDEVDDAASAGRNERALELSRAGSFRPVGVPFKHLVVVAQAAAFDLDTTLETLARTGYGSLSGEAVRERMEYARRWLETHAPDDLRFEVRNELPPAVADLSRDQRAFLGRLAEVLQDSMSGETIHRKIYDLAAEFPGSRPADLFRAIYVALLGKDRGPRAGFFLEVLGPAFCRRRFREAASPV